MAAHAPEASHSVDGGADVGIGQDRDAGRLWLLRHGVPHFTGDYSAGDRPHLLVVPLFAILAYQLGTATWFDSLTAQQLFLAPLVPVAMTLAAARLFLAPFGLGPSKQARWWLLPLALLVPAFAAIVVTSFTSYGRDYPSPWLSPHPWTDFVVIFTALVTAAVLSRPREWARTARGTDKRWLLLAVAVAVRLFFALEGAAFPFIADMVAEGLRNVWPGLPAIPRALPALIAMVLMLVMSIRATRGHAGNEALSRSKKGGGAALAVRALPFLVLALGLDTALLRDFTIGRQSAVAPFAALVALALAFALYQWLPGRFRRLSVWLPLFVVSYPLWTLVMGPPEIMALGRTHTGMAAIIAIAVINSIYVAIAYVVVEWGLDRIALSAYRGARQNEQEWSRSAAHGIPLLLGITALSLLTAEFWEVSTEISLLGFTGFLALLVAPVIVALLVLSVQHLRRQEEEARASRGSRGVPGLSAFEWINGFLIVGAFNSLVFIVLASFSMIFFGLLATVTVPSNVAAEWVYGDGMEFLAPRLEQLPFLDSPWTRVPLVLTAFSVLYVFVSVMATRTQRDDFFGWVRREIRRCFDVRHAYRADALAAPAISATLTEPPPAPDAYAAAVLGNRMNQSTA